MGLVQSFIEYCCGPRDTRLDRIERNMEQHMERLVNSSCCGILNHDKRLFKPFDS